MVYILGLDTCDVSVTACILFYVLFISFNLFSLCGIKNYAGNLCVGIPEHHLSFTYYHDKREVIDALVIHEICSK